MRVAPEHSAPTARVTGVTAVILAGGQSSRMGSNKALLPYCGGRFIESIHRQLLEIFPEVIIVTNHPEQYEFIPCRKVADRYPGMGALAGLHAGLFHAATPHIFAVACDMPYLNSTLIQKLATLRNGADVVIPEGQAGLEPLHALYSSSCLPWMEQSLLADRRRIISFFPQVLVRQVSREWVAAIDPRFHSFSNINTPDEYFYLRAESSTKNPVLNDQGHRSSAVFPVDMQPLSAHSEAVDWQLNTYQRKGKVRGTG